MTSLQTRKNSDSLNVSANTPTHNDWKIKLLYDAQCPLCLREVNFLQRKDAGRGLVVFVDIADSAYEPADNGNVSFQAAMGRIHAVLPDNTVIKNVEVFRQVYSALGMGWLYAPTQWPIVGWLVNKLYGFWADRRLAWTGRPSLIELVAQHNALRQGKSQAQCSVDNVEAADGKSSSRCQME